jgi:hypothetical protein
MLHIFFGLYHRLKKLSAHSFFSYAIHNIFSTTSFLKKKKTFIQQFS